MVTDTLGEKCARPRTRSPGREHQIGAVHMKRRQSLRAWRQSLIFSAMTGEHVADIQEIRQARQFRLRSVPSIDTRQSQKRVTPYLLISSS